MPETNNPTTSDTTGKIDSLIAQGYSNEEISDFFSGGADPSAPEEVDQSRADKIDSLIAQGLSNEEISEALVAEDKQKQEEQVAIEKPEFFEYIPEELHGYALEAFQQNGKEGVISLLGKLSLEDEKAEEALNDIPWLGGILGFDQEDKKNIIDGWDNFKLTIQQAYPNLNFTASRLARSIFGEDSVDKFVDEQGKGSFLVKGISREEQQDAIDAIDILQAQHKDTGKIVGGIKDGDIAESLSGIIASPLNLASTLINTAQTFGAGLFSDMFVETYLPVNEIRAEKLGISLEELINTGQDSVAAPTAFTSVMVMLEAAGLKGVGDYILKTTKGPVKKKLINFLLANNKEGVTELLQYGLGEAAQEWERSDGGVAETGEKFLSSLFTEEALENYATGFFSTGVVSSPKAIRDIAVANRSNQETIDENVDKIADLEDSKKSEPSITKEEEAAINQTISILKEDTKTLVDQPYTTLVNLDEKDLTTLDEVSEQISRANELAIQIESSTTLDESTKKASIETIDNKIAEFHQLGINIAAESNQRVVQQNETVVEGIKEADKLNKQQESINEKRQSLGDQEAALAAAPNPNPSSTKKINRAKKKLDKDEKQLKLEFDNIPEPSKKALESADTVDQAVAETQNKQAKISQDKQRNPIETINRKFSTIKNAEKGEPKIQLKTKSDIYDAREDLETAVGDQKLGTKVDENTYNTPSQRNAYNILGKANKRGLRGSISKNKNEDYTVSIADPTLPGKVSISPTSKVSLKDPYVSQVINKIQKFFGNSLDVEIRPASEIGAYGKVVKENGRIKILISDGSLTQKGVKLDTLFHEPGHILYQLFENSTDPKAKAIFNRIEKLIVKTAEYKEAKAQEAYADLSPKGLKQEAFAKYFGKYAANKTYGDSTLNSVLEKLVEYVQDKFGVNLKAGKLSLKDISDILLADLQTGNPSLFEVSEASVLDAFNSSKKQSFLDAFEEINVLDDKIKTLKKTLDENKESLSKAKLAKLSTKLESLEYEKTILAHVDNIENKKTLKKNQRVNDLELEKASLESLKEAEKLQKKFDEGKLDPQKPLDVLTPEDSSVEQKKASAENIKVFNTIAGNVDKSLNNVPANAIYQKRIDKTKNSGATIAKALASSILTSRKDNYGFPVSDKILGTLSDISINSGNQVVLNLPDNPTLRDKKFTPLHAGWLGLRALIENGVVKKATRRVSGKIYDFIEIVDHEKLRQFVVGSEATKAASPLYTELQSEAGHFIPGETTERKTGAKLVSRMTDWIKSKLGEKDPEGNFVRQLVYDQSERANKVGFEFDRPILALFQRLLGNEFFLYEGKNLDEDAKIVRKTMLEATITKAAEWGDNVFYHIHNFDFRSRFYPVTTYINYQGTKVALSVHKFANKVKLGKKGWEYLLIAATDTWGFKGETFAERLQFAKDNLESWMKIASDPETHLDKWLGENGAKEPGLFIQTISDILKALQEPGGVTEYESAIPLHFDATNSGPMTLALLLKDAVAGLWVNLIGNERKYDLYNTIGDIIWGPIKEPTEAELVIINKHGEEINKLYEALKEAKDENETKAAKGKLDAYTTKNKEELEKAKIAFWGQPHVKMLLRALVKYPVMTKFYSAGAATMAKEIVKNYKTLPGFEAINPVYAKWLAEQVSEETSKLMPSLIDLMNKFVGLATDLALNKEEIGEKVSARKDYFNENKEEIDAAIKEHLSQGKVNSLVNKSLDALEKGKGKNKILTPEVIEFIRIKDQFTKAVLDADAAGTEFSLQDWLNDNSEIRDKLGNPDSDQLGILKGKSDKVFFRLLETFKDNDLGSTSYVTKVHQDIDGFRKLKKSYKDPSESSIKQYNKIKELDTEVSEARRGKSVSYDGAVNNFPVNQEKRKPISKQATLLNSDGSTASQPRIVVEDGKMDIFKIITSASPDTVHSFDAQLVAYVILNSSFDFLTIHDSFGVHAGNAQELYDLIHKGLVDIYSGNPLLKMFEQVLGDKESAKAHFDEVFKDTLVLKGNVDQNQHNHSAGNGSTEASFLDAFEDTKADETLAEKRKKLEEIYDKNTDPTKLAEEKETFEAAIKKGLAEKKGKRIWGHAATDIEGIFDRIVSKTKSGVAQMDWIRKTIIAPFIDADRVSSRIAINISDKMKKASKDTGIKFRKLYKKKVGKHNEETAVLAYLNVKHNKTKQFEGISEGNVQELADYVNNNPKLKQYADLLYEATGDNWIPLDALESGKWLDYGIAGAIEQFVKYKQREALRIGGWYATVDNLLDDAFYENLTESIPNGNRVGKSLRSVVQGMKTGSTFDEGIGDVGKAFIKVASAFTALPIGFNISIGIKQLTSQLNYVEVNGPNNLAAAAGAVLNVKEFIQTVKEIWNSPYGQERLGSKAFDADFGLLTEEGKISTKGIVRFLSDLRRQAIDIGYTPVSWGDLGAIVLGGAPFVMNYTKHFMKEGLSREEARKKAFELMEENSESTQQSKKSHKLSAEQRSAWGKLTLAFKTFQQQAIRKSEKELRHLKRLGKSATLDDKTSAIGNILFYRVLSPALFSLATDAILVALFDDEEEEVDKDFAVSTLRSILEFNAVGKGKWGAIAVVVSRIAEEIYDQVNEGRADSGDIIREASQIIPGASIAGKSLNRLEWALNRSEIDIAEVAAAVTELGVQIPVANLRQYIKNWKFLLERDLSLVKDAHLALGWKSYNLGLKEDYKKREKKKSRSDTRNNRTLRKQRETTRE